jgi:hypothetical protein
MLALAETLHREHPELLFVLDGPGFRSSALTRLDGAAIRVGDDARDALAAIENRMPPLQIAEASAALPEKAEAPAAPPPVKPPVPGAARA